MQVEAQTGIRVTVDQVAEACGVPVTRDCTVSLCQEIHVCVSKSINV